MLRVGLCGRNLDDLRELLRRFPVIVDDGRPEVVISYGGDGALLGAERDFPGVPKCPIRDRRSNPKCELHAEAAILDLLVRGRLAEQRLPKLVATAGTGRELRAINDVQVSKENIASAVRFRLQLNAEVYRHQIVGDGLVVATPFGSTGYYRSITRSLFRVGLGLAFNNTTEPLDHLVIDAASDVGVEILRGPALLLADNDPERVRLTEGDRVRVRCVAAAAVVLGLDIFRCPACYQLRQQPD